MLAISFGEKPEFPASVPRNSGVTQIPQAYPTSAALSKMRAMNLEQLKKNAGSRVQIEPPAIHLDSQGRELPGRNEDWIIARVTDSELQLNEAVELGLSTTIGRDAVHHFTSNPSRSVPGGVQYGFLNLMVQMFIQNDRITYRPCSRPGERVPPMPSPIVEKWVTFNFPAESGLQRKLEQTGFRVAWAMISRLPLLELQGWEIVVEPDRHGMPTSFHLRDSPENQVFVKHRRSG